MLIPYQHNRSVYLGIVKSSTGNTPSTLKYTIECQRDQTRSELANVTPTRPPLPSGIELVAAPNGSPAIIVEAGGTINVYLIAESFAFREQCQ